MAPIQSLIAQHLLEVYNGGNWTENSIKEVLEDVSVKAAETVTAASPNRISAIVHHLTYWNNIMVLRIRAESTDIPETNGFDAPILETQEDWDRLRALNLESARLLSAEILNFEPQDITQPILPGYSSVYKSLHGCIEHTYYHLGQITIIKNLCSHL
ncbi:MAG: DinB family protein [Pedobacter sp.]|uniref:DinB family protein n=1 Tax=Pedobacter sp. TaxID=1411316 RepID=UPI00339B3FD9